MNHIALDAANSKRWKDPAGGYLHVKDCVLSKSSVDPYFGHEIAGCEALGLDPNTKYMLYRPAEELEKALPTINGIPLLNAHDGNFDAANYDAASVIGAIGTDARFESPYLVASLVIYDSMIIDEIEAGERTGLSCGYAYRPIMETGMFGGVGYDMKMTEIRFNHVALVKEGRVGPEAKVADSGEEINKGDGMADEDDDKAVAKDNGENEPEKAGDESGEAGTSPEKGEPVEAEDSDIDSEIDELEKRLAALKSKKSGANDEEPEPKKAQDNKAMDSASVFAIVEKRLTEKYQARDAALDAVRPLVGELRASAMDSAETVYRYALSAKNIQTPEGINLAGLKGMIDAALSARPGFREYAAAMDSVADTGKIDDPFASVNTRIL
jgi:Uncharacterized protein conserved in bacteria